MKKQIISFALLTSQIGQPVVANSDFVIADLIATSINRIKECQINLIFDELPINIPIDKNYCDSTLK